MTDMRRTILWVVFTMSLVLLWDAWNKHTGQPPLFGPAPKAAAPASGAAPGPNAAAPNAAPSASPAAPAATAGVPTAAVAAVPAPGVPAPGAAASAPAAASPAAELVVVRTDVVRASIDPRGGTLVRLELLKFDDTNQPGQPVVLMDQSAKRLYLAQSGFITNEAGVRLPNHLTPMRVISADKELPTGAKSLQVVLESEPVDGRRLRKTYTFTRGEYAVGVVHELINDSAATVSPQLYLQLARDGNPPEGESAFYFTFTGPALYTEAAKFQKIEFKDIEKNKASHEKTANNGWVGMVQHYFASAWLVRGEQTREFRTTKVADNHYAIAMVLPAAPVAAGATARVESTLYAGPQEEYKLAALAPGLELVKDYGWLTVIAKPLFWLLSQLHAGLGNWGWAIVALVVLLKAAFYWLNASAYRSMAKMKAINPRVMEMRERLKDNPQKMQQEMMRIYREEKVNPLGGCLPILVQMPFFIALYWVLLSSVEMRGAAWFWLPDLAQPDRLFTIPIIAMPVGILPILMTASSLVQTWLNPTPPDPMQARLMWIMPIAFSFMFFYFPSGLVLYWLVNNLLSIAQQWMINKRLGVLNK